MLCPKCKTQTMVKRVGKATIHICRNRNCPNYGKEVKPK